MFIEGSKLSAEKINTIQEFRLRFWKNKFPLNDIAVPLGESTTDILNISNKEIINMFNVRNEALQSLRTFFFLMMRKHMRKFWMYRISSMLC